MGHDVVEYKEAQFLDSGDLRFTVSRAKNFESFNAKTSLVAANQGGTINTVGLVAKFFELRKGGPEDLVFVCFKEHKEAVWLQKHVKEDTARQYLREALLHAGISNPEKFTIHSLKTGSVSEARNSGLVLETEVNRHAKWAMSKMVDRYHDSSVEILLKASHALAINYS